MKITFLGATKTVTGSQHLVEVNGFKILLDCGLYQGKRKEAFERNRRSPCIDNLDAIILSHAHIDHSGNVPCRVKNGFAGDIISTSATRDLCAVMLMDSAYLQERDVDFVNRKREKEGRTLFEPLYTKEDVVNTMEHFVGMSYNHKRRIFPGVELTFVDAGHMLGSAHIVLDIEDRDTSKSIRLVFSGDIGRPGIPILRDPQPITGWQSPYTLGRRIVEGNKSVKIFGEEYDVRARVEVITGFSGHADREGLLAWAGAMRKKPQQTFIVHGEEESAMALAQALRSQLGFASVHIPDQSQSFTI